jgi:hypothetical protein
MSRTISWIPISGIGSSLPGADAGEVLLIANIKALTGRCMIARFLLGALLKILANGGESSRGHEFLVDAELPRIQKNAEKRHDDFVYET